MARRRKSRSAGGRIGALLLIGVVVALAASWFADDPSVGVSRGSPSDPATASERALEAKLAMFIDNTSGDGALFSRSRSYVNGDIAHLVATPGWRRLPRAEKLVIIDRMTVWWRFVTGNDSPSWFVNAPGGERIAGWSVFGGSFLRD